MGSDPLGLYYVINKNKAYNNGAICQVHVVFLSCKALYFDQGVILHIYNRPLFSDLVNWVFKFGQEIIVMGS